MLTFVKRKNEFPPIKISIDNFEIRKEKSIYSNSITKRDQQVYYENKKVTKNCKITGFCDVCGKKIERKFDFRGFLRHPESIYCSRECSLNSEATKEKIMKSLDRFDVYKKNIENRNLEINIHLMSNNEIIEIVKNNSNLLLHEKVINLIRHYYLEENLTRVEISEMFNCSVSELKSLFRKTNIKKFSRKNNEKSKISALAAWSDKTKYKTWVNKGGRSKWFQILDKEGKIQKLQGSYELRLANVLVDSNIKWQSFHKQLILSNGDRYAPDFIIENRYIDTKSDYFMQLNKDKLDIVKKELNVIFINNNSLLEIENNPNKIMEMIYGRTITS